MTQPSQSTSHVTDNILLVGLVIAVIVVALAGLFIYSKRGKKSKESKGVKIDSTTKKAVSGKAFCINCGKELPADWKFCRHCGTKQP